MKRILAMLLALSLLLPCFALADEERAAFTITDKKDPTRAVTFTYPASYPTLDLDTYDTFTVGIPDSPKSGVYVMLMEKELTSMEDFLQRYSPVDFSFQSEQVCGMGVSRPNRPYCYDAVQIGIPLENGCFVQLQSFCNPGDTDVYALLSDLVAEFTDPAPVEDWLNTAWLPYILSVGQGN